MKSSTFDLDMKPGFYIVIRSLKTIADSLPIDLLPYSHMGVEDGNRSLLIN